MDIRSFFGGKKIVKPAVKEASASEGAQHTQPAAELKTTIRKTIDDQETQVDDSGQQGKNLGSPVKLIEGGSQDSESSVKRRRLKKVVDSDSDLDEHGTVKVTPNVDDRKDTPKVRNLFEEEIGGAAAAARDAKKTSGHLQLDIDYYTTKEKAIVSPQANLKPTKRVNVDFDTYLSSFGIGAAKAKATDMSATNTDGATNLTLMPKKGSKDDSPAMNIAEDGLSNITTQEPTGLSRTVTADAEGTIQDLFSDTEPVPETSQSSPERSPAKKNKNVSSPNIAKSAAPNSEVAEMRFVFTGELDKIDREKAMDLVKKLGGICVSGVSGRTNYLVCGEKLDDGRPYTTGVKYKKAVEMNSQKKAEIAILNEEQFLKLIVYEKNKELLVKQDEHINTVKETTVATATDVTVPKATGDCYLPFCEKYRPTRLADLIGNEDNVHKVIDWLRNWRPGQGPSCALLSGPPGVGKTTTAKLVAAACGYQCVEFNASDLRNKSSVENIAMLATGGQSFTFTGNCKVKRTLVLLDEVDGMGAGDRGGLQAVVALLPRAMSPIICICNDRHNQKITTLGNKSLDIRFSAPSLTHFTSKVMSVCAAEGIKLPPDAIPQLYEQSGGDFRYVLNTIEFDAAKVTDGNQVDTTRSDKKDMGNTKNIFEAAGRLFSIRSPEGEQRIKDLQQIFFIDYNIMPLMVQENYIKYIQNKRNFLPLVGKLSGTFVEADIVESNLKQRQEFSLLPDLAILSCVIPASEVLRHKGFCRERLMFPQFLGRYSSTSKNRRFLGEIGKHLGSRSSVRSSALVTDGYLNLVYAKIMKELSTGDIAATADMVEAFGLNRELLVDALPSLRLKSQENLYEKIETRKKTALTKRLNELSVKVAPMKRKRETVLRIVDEEEEPLNDSDSESSDSDRELIKQNLKAAKKRPAAKAGGARSGAKSKAT